MKVSETLKNLVFMEIEIYRRYPVAKPELQIGINKRMKGYLNLFRTYHKLIAAIRLVRKLNVIIWLDILIL